MPMLIWMVLEMRMMRRSCTQPSGYILDDQDCDDADAQSNPIMAEICGDGVDNNCDGDTTMLQLVM